MIVVTDSKNCINTIDNIFKNQSYHYVYVSIGSKYNQQDVYFYSSSMPVAKRVDTNALRQMVPLFLYTKPPLKKILNITIDIFNTEQEILFNKRLIESSEIDNMDNVIINMSCNEANIIAFGERILSLVSYNNILETNFMLCNYVKFANSPNPEELHAENNIPIYLEKIFKGNYSKSYYEWYGYKYNLYNCIYSVSYGKQDIFLYKTMNYLNDRMKILSNNHKKEYIMNFDIKITELMSNTYDISSINETEPMIGFTYSIHQQYNKFRCV